MAYKYWTKSEVKILRENYGKTRASDIAKMIGRTSEAVEKKAAKLGISSKHKGSPLWADSAEKLPRYTGKDHWAYRKPGTVWKANGRLWTKRDSDSEPEIYPRYLMEMLGYDLENKHVIHLDGNPLNCEASNLKVVSKAQHARRNYERCSDKKMRSMRMRMARTGESLVDLILKAEI